MDEESKYDSFLQSNEARLARVIHCTQIEEEDDLKNTQVQKQNIFSLESFKEAHPNFSCKSFTNFSEEELEYLITKAEEVIGSKHRGKRPKVSPRDQLFLTLSFFHVYETYEVFSQVVHVQVPTLQRIVRRVVLLYFPVF